MLLVLFVASLVALALSSLFNIKSIQISGLTRYSEGQLIEASNLQIDKNWFKLIGINPYDWLTFRSRTASQKIRDTFSYIDDTAVTLVPFGKVKISIVERQPAFLVSSNEKLIVIDKDGICLDAVESTDKFVVPILENSTVKNYTLGNRIEFGEPYVLENLNKLSNLIKTSDTAEGNKLEPLITSIDLSMLDRAYVVLESRVKVNLGDINKVTEYKIAFIKQVFYDNIKKLEKGTLDFSGDENPVFKPE